VRVRVQNRRGGSKKRGVFRVIPSVITVHPLLLHGKRKFSAPRKKLEKLEPQKLTQRSGNTVGKTPHEEA